MPTSVTINWAVRQGDQVVVDASVAGTHHRVQMDHALLDKLGTKAARQTFIAQQCVAVNGAPSPNTAPTGSVLDVAGTLSV